MTRQIRFALLAALGLAAVLIWLSRLWAEETRSRRDAWDRIQARGIVRVGMDASYPPFEWVDAEGVFYGYDVALARALAEHWGVQVEFANIHFDALYDALYTGRVDLLLSALPYDHMLTRDVRYSQPYFTVGQVLLVPEDRSEIQSTADLRGATVAVELGATAHQLARTLDRDRGLGLSVRPFRELDAAAQAVSAGEADALICDRVSALSLRARYPLRQAGPPLTDEPYVIAVRPDSMRLLREINAALSAWQADGTLEELAREWLGP